MKKIIKQILRTLQLPPLTVVKVIAVRPDGKMLVLRRTRVISLRKETDLPGGIVDKGEDLLSAVKRETFEEVGLKVKNIRPIGKSTFWAMVGPIRLHGFVCEVEGEVKLSWEHNRFWWSDPKKAGRQHKLKRPYRGMIFNFLRATN